MFHVKHPPARANTGSTRGHLGVKSTLEGSACPPILPENPENRPKTGKTALTQRACQQLVQLGVQRVIRCQHLLRMDRRRASAEVGDEPARLAH